MARLLLVRHAPTPDTGRLLTGRLAGVKLSEEGRRQAAVLADHLAGVRLAAVYSSPLERTWETAEAIAAARRLQPVAHDGLLEVDYGRWSGRPLAALQRLKLWEAVQTTPSRVRFPEGETLLAAQARAVAACEEVASRHRRRTVCLVTHADIIKAVLSHYLGQPLDLFQRLGCAPGSLSVLDLPPAGPPRVAVVNGNGDPATWR